MQCGLTDELVAETKSLGTDHWPYPPKWDSRASQRLTLLAMQRTIDEEPGLPMPRAYRSPNGSMPKPTGRPTIRTKLAKVREL